MIDVEKKNKKAWKGLENFAISQEKLGGLLDFIDSLLKMYDENLDILIACVEDSANINLVSQAYLKSEDDKRYMICFTSINRAIKTPQGTTWRAVSSKIVMNNMFNRDEIAGLVFNPFDEQQRVIMTKDILLKVMNARNDVKKDQESQAS